MTGIHIFTFSAVASAVAWAKGVLAAAPAPAQ